MGFRTLFACSLLAACATVGTKFDTTHVNDIKKGEQDKAVMAAWFGQPHRTQALANQPTGCVERWQWTYAHSAVGAGTVSDALIVDFDSAGKVCDNAYSQVGR